MARVNVLMIEDQESDAELILAALRRAGFDPVWRRVTSEAEYLAVLSGEAGGPRPDVILADFNLPQFTGIRALELLRQRGEDIPFILVSGTIGEDTAVESIKLGATDYLLKDRLARLGPAIRQALEQKDLRDLKERQRRHQDALNAVIVEASRHDDFDALLSAALEHTLAALDLRMGAVWLGGRAVSAGLPESTAARIDLATKGSRLEQSLGDVIVEDWDAVGPSDTAAVYTPIAAGGGVRAVLAVPIFSGERRIGAVAVGSPAPRRWTPEETAMVKSVARELGTASERRWSQQRILRQLARLQALRDIDTAISGSLDARVTLSIFLDKVTTHLQVDAADILLLNPGSQTLEYLTGRGFRTSALQHTRLRLGSGHAGQAALERRTISVPNLAGAAGRFDRSPLLTDEQFVSYYAVPLIAKGQTHGVLEVFHRQPLAPDDEWLDFLSTLAGQAAIAIDSTRLFDNLQRANMELTLAYDTTLEGWSRALDLRDRETEGHTQRVTEVTVRLARAVGISDDTLVHVRRGALLHDIGKMGIPDSILLKPGPLTEDEWEIMRRHPVYAHELLSPITYLRPALAIPYAHHEKWDGTGYPRGLKGDEIPLEARVFAVVDVWDALTSDRPYRPAWPKDKARGFIREQAGTHFDPRVAEVFLQMIDDMNHER